MTTWSPQSTCGVKLGLCLPRRILATIVASRPTTRPSASIRCHFFSTSAGLTDLVVFISAFMAPGPFETSSAAHMGPHESTTFMGTLGSPVERRERRANGSEASESQENRAFDERYYVTLRSPPRPRPQKPDGSRRFEKPSPRELRSHAARQGGR